MLRETVSAEQKNKNDPFELMKIYTRSGKKINNTDRVLDLLTEGVQIVTTHYSGDDYGLAAAWVMRIAGSPHFVMTAVALSSNTYPYLQKAGFFGVNILAEDQVGIARHFGRQTGHEVNKFKRQDIYWDRKVTGAPIMLDALAYLDCRLVDVYQPPGGDHALFIGEVIDAGKLREGEALIYRREDYPYRVDISLIESD